MISNQSESFNAVLKDFEKWKEAPIDSAMLSFYFLQVYCYNTLSSSISHFRDKNPGNSIYVLIPQNPLWISLKAVPPASILASIRSKTLSNDTIIDDAPVCEPVEDAAPLM